MFNVGRLNLPAKPVLSCNNLVGQFRIGERQTSQMYQFHGALSFVLVCRFFHDREWNSSRRHSDSPVTFAGPRHPCQVLLISAQTTSKASLQSTISYKDFFAYLHSSPERSSPSPSGRLRSMPCCTPNMTCSRFLSVSPFLINHLKHCQ